jgi:hypothetical protein
MCAIFDRIVHKYIPMALKLNSLIKPYYCNLRKLQVRSRLLSDLTLLMFLLVGNHHRYLFLVSICLFSVIPSAPRLLFPPLPACIIQEDKANDNEWRGQQHQINVFL